MLEEADKHISENEKNIKSRSYSRTTDATSREPRYHEKIKLLNNIIKFFNLFFGNVQIIIQNILYYIYEYC